jgi:hypothetical protein
VSVATKIVDDILNSGNFDLWYASDDQSYISMEYADLHVEHHPLKAKTTRQWLANFYYKRANMVAGSSALTDAIAVLEGHAQTGLMHEVYIRIGGADGAIYLDLCNEAWEAIEITANGWKLIKKPPVKFQRTSGMLPLPEPVSGGSLDDLLQPLLNAESDDSWLLMKAWLLGLLRPKGPYPILALRGEQDTAKSYTQKLLRAVVDPSILPIRRPAKKVEDLMIAAKNHWIVSFDNMSKIGDDLSDDLCCVATGGGIAKRALWTASNETILQVCRPIIMNGIEDIITRPDLLDRSIYITLPQIPEEKRKPEGKLLAEFNEKLPKILGALLDAAVIAMQKQDEIVLNDPYRMADFVKWAAAGLGNEGNKFQEAYRANRIRAARESIEDDLLIIQLKAFISQYCNPFAGTESWKGNATKLLEILRRGLDERDINRLPKAANALSGKLRRLAPALRKDGINVQRTTREGKGNTVQWEISAIKSK